MSNYEVNPDPGAPAGRTVMIGWDAPLSTFFGTVMDPHDDEPVLWVGGEPHGVRSVEELAEALAPHVALSPEKCAQLAADQQAEGHQLRSTPGGVFVARTTLESTADADQAAAIMRELDGGAS